MVPFLPFLVYFSPFGPKPILSHTQIAYPFFVEKLRHWDALAGSEPLRNFWQAVGVIIEGEFLHIGILKVQRHQYFYTGCFFFYFSALNIRTVPLIKRQRKKKFNYQNCLELFLRLKFIRKKKVSISKLILPYSWNSSNSLTFIVRVYWRLTLRTFSEEQ